jgi:DNA-binding MarR family transcriptional regulator
MFFFFHDAPDRVRHGRSIQNLCAAISREAQRRAQARLGKIGLSSGAYNLLSALNEQDDMTIADVRRVLRIESATVSTLVARMERDGLITKVRSPNDKRSSFLKATEHARALLQEADQIMIVEATDLTHRLTEAEQLQIVSLLEKVLANIDTSS